MRLSRRLLSTFLQFWGPKWSCPICYYRGAFLSVRRVTGRRRFAKCPACGALERHRIQAVVVGEVLKSRDLTSLSLLHFAPEPFFRDRFRKDFGTYETADLFMHGVDHTVDIQDLPFDDGSYDVVYASHVLEHIPDDRRALAEVGRILRPGGFAFLPVPLLGPTTVEYPGPNPFEEHHVRAPGYDYYDRYEDYFDEVVRYGSDDLPAEHQLWVHEDRSKWPTEKCPLRVPMTGDRHRDVVAVCFKS